ISMPAPRFEATMKLEDNLKAVGFSAPFTNTALLGNLGKSVNVKIDRVDQSISFELISKEIYKEIDGAVSTNVNVNNSYYYMFTHRETGCRTLMGKKTR
ncbi:MAG: hypothetical protein IIW54_07470, partial [Lachnospiraceae bacterium]|nr:hypothetical protein [Lachnospiraceae bacterium]